MRLYHGSNVLGLDVLEPRIADHMREKNMLEMPECSYVKFVREKIPRVWEMLEDEKV